MNSTLHTYLKLVGAVLAWGGTFVAARLAVADAPAEISALLRFVIASLVLLWILYRRNHGLPRLDRIQLGYVLLLGASGVAAYNLFFFYGLQTVEAGRGALIITSNPLWVALGSILLFGQRFNRWNLLGFVLCVAGVSIVLAKGEPWRLLQSGVGPGELALLGCALSWSIYTLTGKKLMNSAKPLPPLALVAYSCTSGSVILAVWVLSGWILTGGVKLQFDPGWSFSLSILYLALIGTVAAFVWFFQAVSKIGAAQSAVFVFLVPISAILFGAVLLGEKLTVSLVFGGLLTLSGVALVNRKE